MITLPGRCEFLSDAWLDEARKFLERECKNRKERLGKRPFSLSERFTNAPPHLKFADDVAAWSMRYDGESIHVSRDFDGAADLVVEGDYQAALTAAQFVGVLAPGAMAAMVREVATMFGKDALRVKGALGDEQANEMIMLLHDHMGRRTVENPDLAHRAARQGLSGKIREMEEQGYTILERAISPEFADQVRSATLRALLPHQTFSMNWMLYHGREFEQLIQNPLMLTLLDASLGRGAVIASFSCIKKGPGPGVIPMHTDYAHVPEPYPEFSLTGVGVWALEDWRVESGPTWIVPGSNKFRRPPRPNDSREGGIPIEMPKGSVVFFTHGVWHWQGDRTEPGDRVTLHAHFNRGILRSLEPKKTDVQMLHRNSPRLAEMLGEDDWFDKMSAAGRDHVRFNYMQQLHAFTEKQKRALLAGDAN
ncbi:MAG: phytanoyl-CoA dioxygenase family protein [Candidatus Binatus sp.]|uniref:phytanoyl-CoA dioxygenase family protein n=1 Tax=Candidatus Binatus sp. TaxID=2811406 RepID=UPI0027226480|nr:phytanoyl-CoA dioxygenase family protein [Candidatus Binatus sp.]MDO8434109.1 phytanoyl-CoA dioxygenase family protein [Candidatus Binatus sp.]